MQNEERDYKCIFLLPADMQEKLADEFIQKFEAQVQEQAGTVKNVNKIRQSMVKTSQNRGSRHVYTITMDCSLKPSSVYHLRRYLRLARGTVVGQLILREEEIKVKQEA